MIREIIIKNSDKVSKGELLDKIHLQLKGNPDYIDSNIVLSDDDFGTEDNLITIYFTEEATNIPKIIL